RDAIGMRAAARYETRADDVLPLLGSGEIEVAATLQSIPKRVQRLRAAVDDVEYEALEVRRLRDVHRRARSRLRLVGAPGPVARGAEEFVEDVVLVGRENEPAYRQADRARDVPGEDIAEVSRRDGEVDDLALLFRHREIGAEIVDDLRGNPRPVDRVDRADLPLRLERRVGRHR